MTEKNLFYMALAVLLFASTIRVQSLVAVKSAEQQDPFLATGFLGTVESSAESASGVFRVERQVFDPDAKVILAVGADSLPGQAGFDDNFNGVVDDRGEMGAVGSDDLCLAPWNAQYQDWADCGNDVVVISRGAFVPIQQSGHVNSNQETRFLLYGRSGEKSSRVWTRLVLPK